MKIICIGRNYPNDNELQVHDEPAIFLKPDSAILRVNNPFFVPDFAKEFYYETEIVVRISRLGRYIDKRFAHRYYDSVGIGIDFTAHDLLEKLCAEGKPWECAKAFDQSAGISEFVPKSELGDVQNIDFRLEVNGEVRQKGNTSQMLRTMDEIVAYVSTFFTLKIGDLIYTGTPAGSSAVKIGDRLRAYIEDRKMMDFLIK